MDLLQDLDAYVSVYHEMYIKARNESEGLPMYFKHKEKEICNEVKEEHNWLNSNYIEALVEYRLWVHMWPDEEELFPGDLDLVRKLEDRLRKKRGKNGVVKTESAGSNSVTPKSASSKLAKTKPVKSEGAKSMFTRSKSSKNGTYTADGAKCGLNLNIVGLAGVEDHNRVGYPLPRGIGPDGFMPEPRANSRPAEAYSQFRSTRVFFGLDSVKGRPAPITSQGYYPNRQYPNIEDPQAEQEVKSGGSIIEELSEEGSSTGGKSK